MTREAVLTHLGWMLRKQLLLELFPKKTRTHLNRARAFGVYVVMKRNHNLKANSNPVLMAVTVNLKYYETLLAISQSDAMRLRELIEQAEFNILVLRAASLFEIQCDSPREYLLCRQKIILHLQTLVQKETSSPGHGLSAAIALMAMDVAELLQALNFYKEATCNLN